MRHIEVAAKLSGKALAVFLAVHHRVALTGETSVSLPMSMLEGMELTNTLRRGHCLH